ncbi:MAG TPA: hypothetical protein VNW97_22995 [Candidatus Saccharimonadales bacterium]|nr:hypothetical protein [Candidatus Saccharimonadales bacterium]
MDYREPGASGQDIAESAGFVEQSVREDDVPLAIPDVLFPSLAAFFEPEHDGG